ncbi:MAG: hypothetical protein ACYC2G_14185 [Gemmatimonadaceae bacterium]
MPLRLIAAAALATTILGSGCAAGDAAAVSHGGAPDTTAVIAGTVDSVIPLPEALRRFRTDLQPLDTLSGGATSREELVERFVDALSRRDTMAVRGLVLDRAEFAYLYYPSSEYAAPPRAQAPALAWFLIQQNSEKGITRAFRRLGGQRLEADSLACDPEPRVEGENRMWSGCTVSLLHAAGDGSGRRRLFGSIIERDGRFKFVSYANEF